MGLEPTISCLGSKRSTTELHPLEQLDDYKLRQKGMSSLVVFTDKRRSRLDVLTGRA